jgi:4-hydroxythreonine-4-phosphate dehydrogenase
MEPSPDTPLVLTQGDPRGIGPELLLRLAAEGELREGDVVVASPSWLERWAHELPQPWAMAGWARLRAGLHAVDVDEPGAAQVRALERGVDLVLEHRGRALVTAPIDKRACHDAGFSFPGHTEYLAHRAGGVEVAMLMVGARLRVVPVTIHVPLRRVPELLTGGLIEETALVVEEALRRDFGIDRPRLAVAGLNPHAGEGGALGEEDGRVIAPAVARLRERGLDARGPLPADTMFHAEARRGYDAALCMYHDQALIPLKALAFDRGVNVTLGLPFVRPSPDHGTALDIAGRGVARPESLIAAIATAAELAGRRAAARGRRDP